MNTKPKFIVSILLATVILLVNFGGMPGIAYAQDGDGGLIITVTPDIFKCGDVEYNISWTTGSPSYLFVMDYGDGITSEKLELDINNKITLNHTYFVQGENEWTITVETVKGEPAGTDSGVITIVSPAVAVTLSSEPFPPLVVLGPTNDPADDTVVFTASVIGGIPPYSYFWDRDGVSEQVTLDTDETIDKASFIFTVADKYQAQVKVTDNNNCVGTASLPVVVVDQGVICHPTAKKIADAVNTIFPAQAGDLYTCEEIYDFFNGGLTGDQLGFGRMWKAYNLAVTMKELTWEEIRDWHLDTGGWGALLQLDRFSDLLEDHSIVDLMGKVMSEEYTLGDVRIAVRSTTRYEADFEDALARSAGGATAGELGQFYQLAADLKVDPAALDVLLAGEFTLSELKHAANLADRMGVVWTEIADAGGVQVYMKDLREADKLEQEVQQAAQMGERNTQTAHKLVEQFSTDFDKVMGMFEGGVCEGDWGCVRKALRDQEQTMTQAEGPSEKDLQTADKLAEQYPDYPGDVMSLFNGDCEENWGCVRKTLREQEQAMTQADVLPERDFQTAQQIASKYGVPDYQTVIDYYEDDCSGDWACTRAHFRELFMSAKETGKP